MAVIRASIRLIFIFILISVGALLLLPFRLPFIPKSVFLQVKNKLVFWISSATIWLLNIELTIQGKPPKPPFFLVSNHLSYLEIILFWRVIPCTYIAKADIKKWPFFGFIARLIDIHFIDRSNKRDIPRLNNKLSESINELQGVVLFPEGTSTRGEDVLPFKSPLFQYPASEGIAVSTATITYATESRSKPASEFVCWWGDMNFFDHFFELLKLKLIQATIVFGDEEFISQDRKRLATNTYQTVKKNFVPLKNTQPMENPKSLIEINIEFLEQGKSLLQQIDDHNYTHSDNSYYDSGVGKHMRHILDHYESLVEGWNNKINYDDRIRGTEVETSRQKAISVINYLIQSLHKFEDSDYSVNQKVLVKSNEGVNCSNTPWSSSSIKRELQFLISHTVHHYALIGFILKSQDIEVPDSFGVAPSTLRYEKMTENN